MSTKCQLCSFPAVLDVVLFNREERLVLQTSAVGIPLPSIKWYSQETTLPKVGEKQVFTNNLLYSRPRELVTHE